MDQVTGWLLLPIAILTGFFLPGFFLSRLLRSPETFIVSFCLSVLVLYQGVFWLGLLGFRLSFGLVLAFLLTVLGGVILAAWRWPAPAGPRTLTPEPQRSPLRLATLLAVCLVALVMFLRSTFSPLSGGDTTFRWNFLSLQLLNQGSFAFYPPRSPADFKSYFFVDGIPPLVSFSYWWLYAALGQAEAGVTGLLVTGQFLAVCALCYYLASQVHSQEAGLFAVLLLLSCPLFFWAIVIGQETGWTALSLGTGLYLIAEARHGHPLPRMILAGLVIAVGALSREYGLAFLFCGIVAAWYLGISWKPIVAFSIAALLACGPWYVRNWVLTGNPVYSNPVAGLFPVNPIHAGIVAGYRAVLGLNLWNFLWLMLILVAAAPLLLLFGAFGSLVLRRMAHFLVAIGVVALLWIYSVPQTSGGYYFTLRVLSPAFLLLAVLGGAGWASARMPLRLKQVSAIVVFLACAWAVPADLYVPASVSEGLASGLLFLPSGTDDHLYEGLAEVIRPLDCRVLTDNAGTHARLVHRGIDVVPVWSPEVRFLFEEQLSPEAMRRRLIASGIRLVEFAPNSLNRPFLEKSPFYSQDWRNWDLVAQWHEGAGLLYFLPDDTSKRP